MKISFITLLLSMIVLLSTTIGVCEDISNYADCDVCHGSIHISPLETKEILGVDGLQQLANLPVKRVLKIDLDGMLKQGDITSSDEGFEVKIWVMEGLLFIKDLRDGSLIQLVGFKTDSVLVDIYLESGKEDEIDLKDSVDDAWMKMKTSHIYNWVGTIESKKEWYAAFQKKIISVVQMLKK